MRILFDEIYFFFIETWPGWYPVDTQREDLMGGLGCKLPYGGTELLKTRWPVGSTMATTFSSFCVSVLLNALFGVSSVNVSDEEL